MQLSFTFVSIPALLDGAPSTLATQWKTLYDRAVTPVVTLAMTSSVGFTALAYRATYSSMSSETSWATKRNLYIAAAIAAFGVAPYTRLLMWDNIAELERLAKAAGKGTATPATQAFGPPVVNYEPLQGVYAASFCSV